MTSHDNNGIIELKPGTVIANRDPHPWQRYSRWVIVSFDGIVTSYISQRLEYWANEKLSDNWQERILTPLVGDEDEKREVAGD